jgi:hypothetical protein
MSTENTADTATETSTSPTSAADLTQSLTAETPSSTVDNVQTTGDFASWLDGKFNSFEKGQEVAPWDKKEEADPEQNSEEAQTETDTEKVEEKPDTEESDEEVDSEDTKTMTGSAGAKFKQLKTELKSYKSKVAEMEKMLADKEAQSGNSEESSQQLETLKTKLEEYEREIAVSRIEASPQFKEAVLGPTQTILDFAISLAEKYEVAPRKLVDALREESTGDASDSLTEMASDFSERDRIRLYRMADDLAEVSRRRDYLKENAAKAMAEMAEKQKAYEVAAEKEYREESIKVANTTWSETFENNPVIQSLGEEIVKELRSSATESDLLNTAPEERAYAVYAGVALPHLVKKYAEISNKLAETEKALGKYKKATPKVSGNVDTSSQKQELGGFLDAVEKRFALG